MAQESRSRLFHLETPPSARALLPGPVAVGDCDSEPLRSCTLSTHQAHPPQPAF